MSKNEMKLKQALLNKNDENLTEIWVKLNGFITIEGAEAITTLDKTTQYRERLLGRFPKLVPLTSKGRRKGYRVQDLQKWMQNPKTYSQGN